MIDVIQINFLESQSKQQGRRSQQPQNFKNSLDEIILPTIQLLKLSSQSSPIDYKSFRAILVTKMKLCKRTILNKYQWFPYFLYSILIRFFSVEALQHMIMWLSFHELDMIHWKEITPPIIIEADRHKRSGSG